MIVLLLGISGVIFFSCQPKQKIKVDAFEVENGWGYQLSLGDKVFIHQPFIPAVSGQQAFVSKAEALKTGNFVLQKMRNHEPPAISVHELDSLRITYIKSDK